MKFLAQLFDEMSERIAHIRNQRILGWARLHVRRRLYSLRIQSLMEPMPEIIRPGGSLRRQDSALSDEQLDTLARLLDDAFAIPGTNWRFGLDAIVGLIPGIGDLITSIFSFLIVFAAWQRGLPRVTIARMVANIAVDTLVGAMPIVGDLFDAAWKSNKKNVALLKRASAEQTAGAGFKHRAKDWLALILLVTAAIAMVAVPIWVLIWLLRHAF
jgi:hypothetical protein